METKEYRTVIITPAEGMFLTRARQPEDITLAVVSTRVALGQNDSPSDWREITADEADEIRAAQLAAMEAKANPPKEEPDPGEEHGDEAVEEAEWEELPGEAPSQSES